MEQWTKANKIDGHRGVGFTMSLQVVSDDSETTFRIGSPHQYRFPRSKKRRVRKKWSNNPRNWRMRWDEWSAKGIKAEGTPASRALHAEGKAYGVP